MNNPWGPPGPSPLHQGPQPAGGQQPWGRQAPPKGPSTPEAPNGQFSQDSAATLSLLSLLHYVYAGVDGVLAGTLGTGGLWMAVTVYLDLPVMTRNASGGHVVDADAGVEAAVICAIALVAFVSALLHVLSGRSLAKRRRYVLLVLLASISLLVVPFGTLIGVATLATLRKPGVKALFERARAGS